MGYQPTADEVLRLAQLQQARPTNRRPGQIPWTTWQADLDGQDNPADEQVQNQGPMQSRRTQALEASLRSRFPTSTISRAQIPDRHRVPFIHVPFSNRTLDFGADSWETMKQDIKEKIGMWWAIRRMTGRNVDWSLRGEVEPPAEIIYSERCVICQESLIPPSEVYVLVHYPTGHACFCNMCIREPNARGWVEDNGCPLCHSAVNGLVRSLQ